MKSSRQSTSLSLSLTLLLRKTREEKAAPSVQILLGSLPEDLTFGIHGMMEEEEADGLLKVIIVQGKNLAIRDFTSSDPYVVVKVGNQLAKTKVINCCLFPVWNEELKFFLKEPLGVLKLEVFDRDRFKSDDKMGHAFLDLQPLASASKLKRALQLTTGETKLRKVAPDTDNCLLASSFITFVDGEIVLDVCLRLCDVESGELYVTVKWIDHPATGIEVKSA